MKWGLLGPEILSSQRRVRTLGLATVVRHFNDLAVPGMGGVWFGKQLLIASIGVALAQEIRKKGRQVSNIETANAVEALSCWLTLDHNGWAPDARVLGRLKLRNKTDDLSFRRFRRHGFYVTQPMRMRTVQPLLALGFVESANERFNSFECAEVARNFIEAACRDYRPRHTTILKNLLSWAEGEADCVKTAATREALSPTEPLSDQAREILREALIGRTSDRDGRRSKLLDWMDDLQSGPKRRITWEERPEALDAEHWRDIRSGGHFFSARNAAIQLLDSIEAHLGGQVEQRLKLTGSIPDGIKSATTFVRTRAKRFLAEAYDPSPARYATEFCVECSDADDRAILKKLVERDGRVLQLLGDAIVPGWAFRGWKSPLDEDESDGEDEGAVETDHEWPEGISFRVRNMLLLSADLRGRLDHWLRESNGGQ